MTFLHNPQSTSTPPKPLKIYFRPTEAPICYIWSSMEARPTYSELTIGSTLTTAITDTEKAWHLLALLLSLGRTARPAELASRCALFCATPELVESFCSIPDSPILLTPDLHVTVSPVALTALAEFASSSNSVVSCTPRMGMVVCGTNRLGYEIDFGTMCSRKRKLFTSSVCELAPVPKISRILSSGAAEEEEREWLCSRKLIQYVCPKVLFHMMDAITRNINLQSGGDSVLVNKFMVAHPMFSNFNGGQVTCQLKNLEHVEGDHNTSLFPQGKPNMPIMACELDQELALLNPILDNLVGCKDWKINESGFGSRKFSTTCGPEGATYGNISPLEAANVDDAFEATQVQIVENGRVMEDDQKEKLVDSGCLHKDGMAAGLHGFSKSSKHCKVAGSPKENRQCGRHRPSKSKVQKLKHNHDDMLIKGRGARCTPPKDQQEQQKALPSFESYTVIEEEGSGGYGTVYRARRKSDGAIVAIKCPHANAHRHHVSNEMKMLEQFGGKNFVINYKGCFKHGNSDCFVLEHVDHDRPEVLKKEIDVFQLRWYGYCMFRALAVLHRQGILHRDVKPGNFLFSRKTNKGYLIDFNLAMDLSQNCGNTGRSRIGSHLTTNHIMVSNSKSISPTDNGKFSTAKTSQGVNRETTRGSRSALDPKNLKRKALGQAEVYSGLGSRNVIKSQGADGSGITSAKDVTSARTPSAERRREPMPCHGRKELISLLQEAMKSPNHEAIKIPVSSRKRVSASPREVDSKLVYITPMPLLSTVTSVTGAGSTNKRGDGKHKKEGPCVGTKGFRAPEVLFKSLHQGPKVDIWSAGVTLLYLMTGRMPFFGNHEQNVKDIAKLRGSEDLWEVAKLHNRESSFPVGLYHTQWLPSIKLQDWCETNTKRPEFLGEIPNSLFDLLEKCLTVNPRVRISAEEALKHEFFAKCHEDMRRE